MENQLSLFDNNYNDYDPTADIQNMIDEVIASHNLPEKSIHLYSNVSTKGKNAGKEISKSICIYEPPYPAGMKTDNTPGRNFVILRLQLKTPKNNPEEKRLELSIRNEQFDSIDLPASASDKVLKSSPDVHIVTFHINDVSLLPYIKANIIYCLANYKSSASFGCCSRFIECSDARKCVHENRIYSMGCKYRANLEMGRIFYGKNKNI